MRKLALVLAITACTAPTAPAGSSEAIVNGTIDYGDPAVGSTQYGCTATLIGRRTALTAAHCIPGEGVNDAFCLSWCSNNGNCADCVHGVGHRYPGYDGSLGGDIGVIALYDDATTALGVQPLRVGATPAEGQSIYMVGFGCTTTADGCTAGVKYSGYNTVDSVGSSLIDYDNLSLAYAWYGDSGGPVMNAHSDCEIGINVGHTGSSIWNGWDDDWEAVRIDAMMSWIASVAYDSTVYQCGQTRCGDGFCQSPESCSTCPADCGACNPNNPCAGQPDGTDCGDDCCTGFNKCKGGVCTTGTCCNTTHCCSL